MRMSGRWPSAMPCWTGSTPAHASSSRCGPRMPGLRADDATSSATDAIARRVATPGSTWTSMRRRGGRCGSHLASVRAFFAGRDDLLEVDVTALPRWDELARFLEVEVPDVPFPTANVDGRPGPSRYPTFRRIPAKQPGRRGQPRRGVSGLRMHRERASWTVVRPGPDRTADAPPAGRSNTIARCGFSSLIAQTCWRGPHRVLHVNARPLFDRMAKVEGVRPEQLAPGSRGGDRSIAPDGNTPGFPLINLSALDVADGAYDFVIAPHVLQQVADDRIVLRELVGSLPRVGGCC